MAGSRIRRPSSAALLISVTRLSREWPLKSARALQRFTVGWLRSALGRTTITLELKEERWFVVLSRPAQFSARRLYWTYT
ncbi:hypothetical protein G5714_003335 [Onychostoma macrolepis]|uniref:Uncharacterized protein n=1 Tax=Onychostoma macrolepis TaxID=369639 RepID=A0A7J6D966_9TELE|nr:hypothetical protein G5714_003335 [Onychostoma macrolepis]